MNRWQSLPPNPQANNLIDPNKTKNHIIEITRIKLHSFDSKLCLVKQRIKFNKARLIN